MPLLHPHPWLSYRAAPVAFSSDSNNGHFTRSRRTLLLCSITESQIHYGWKRSLRPLSPQPSTAVLTTKPRLQVPHPHFQELRAGIRTRMGPHVPTQPPQLASPDPLAGAVTRAASCSRGAKFKYTHTSGTAVNIY